MKYQKILSKLGLSEQESITYLDLLENGPSTVVDISNRTKLNRPLLYKILPSLIETGLISEVIRGKRKLYKGESPEHLRNIFESFSANFLSIIPELEEIYTQKDLRPNIQILSGKKGIRHVFEDVVTTLKKGDVYYRYSARKNFGDKYLLKHYQEMREKKQIQRMVITSEERAKQKSDKLDREVVHIPAGFDLFDQNAAKLIYANKVAIIDYNSEMAFIIENKILADFEEKIFKTLFIFLRRFQDLGTHI